MKPILKSCLCCLVLCLALMTTQSCAKKVGCPANEKVHAEVNKKGKVKGKAKSGILPKKQARKANKKRKKKS